MLVGRCYEDAPVPYQPFVEALRQYLAAPPARRASMRTGRRLPGSCPSSASRPTTGAGPTPKRSAIGSSMR